MTRIILITLHVSNSHKQQVNISIHKEFMDCLGSISSFCNGPNHQRLPSPAIPSSKHFSVGSSEIFWRFVVRCNEIASLNLDSNGLTHSRICSQETQCQKNKIGLQHFL